MKWDALIAVFSVAVSASSLAADLRVPHDHGTIQAAMDAAVKGDTVLVSPGEYLISEPLNFHGKGIAVLSLEGAERTTIRMSEAPRDPERSSVVIFESGETEEVLLEGFTITGGKGTPWNWMGPTGGGIHAIRGSSPRISRCIISGNSASGSGGGIFCNDSHLTLTNSIITGNLAGNSGGLHARWAWPTLINCTITGNSADQVGGVSSSDDATVFLINCIDWGNSPEQPYNQGLYSTLSDRDPLFVNASAGDFHLQPGSPALDSGRMEGAPATDFDGNGRPCGSGVDIGAYESAGCLPPESVRLVIQVSPERGGMTEPAPGAYALQDGTVVSLLARPAPGYHFWYWEGTVTDRRAPQTAVRIEGTLLTTVIAYFYPNSFVRGDANADFRTSITDPIAILRYLFLGQSLPCLSAADANDDGRVDVSDAARVLGFLFLGGDSRPAPYRGCNADPTEDNLICESYPGCG